MEVEDAVMGGRMDESYDGIHGGEVLRVVLLMAVVSSGILLPIGEVVRVRE